MPFEKGKSGNPGGRPRKGSELRNTLQDFFIDQDPVLGKQRAQVLLEKAYEKAKSAKGTMMDILEFFKLSIAPLKAVTEAEESGDDSEDKVLKVEVTYTKTPEASTEINPADDPV
jgi:hypothetical protein